MKRFSLWFLKVFVLNAIILSGALAGMTIALRDHFISNIPDSFILYAGLAGVMIWWILMLAYVIAKRFSPECGYVRNLRGVETID